MGETVEPLHGGAMRCRPAGRAQDLAPMVARIEAGEVAMHEPEQRLAAGKRRGDRALYALTGGRSWGGLPVDATTVMWNAGVVGVGAGRRDAVDRALAACDTLC